MAEKRLHIRLMVSEDGTVKVQRLTDDLKKLEGQGQSTGVGMASGLGKASTAVAALGTAVAALSVAAVVKLAEEFGNLSIKATQLSADFEQTKIAFSTMLGSAANADKFLGELEAFAARTPFEFPELVQSARMMKAFNFETQAIIPNMEAIGDAAAGLGAGSEGVQRIVRSLGQMQAKTKASAEEMMQLAEIGVNGWQYIADAAGKSVAEVQKQSEKGAVSANFAIQAILDGFRRDFGGMMEAQSQTTLGLFSTLKDNVGFALKDMGDVILSPVKAALKQIGVEFDKLRENGMVRSMFQDLGQDAALFLAPVIKLFGFLIGRLQTAAYYARELRLYFRDTELSREQGLLSQMRTRPEEVPGRFILKSAEEREAAIEAQAALVDRLTLEYNALSNAQHRAAATYEETEEAIRRVTDALEQNISTALRVQQGGLRGGADVLTGDAFMGGFAPDKAKFKPPVARDFGKFDVKGADATGPATDYKALRQATWDSVQSRLNIERQRLAAMKEMASDEYEDKLRKIQAIAFWEREAARENQRIASEEFDASLVRNEWRQKQAQAEAEDARNLALETAQMGGAQFEEAMNAAAAIQERVTSINAYMIGLGNNISESIGGAFAQSLVYGKSLMSGIEDAFKQLAALVIQKLIEIMVQAIIVNTILAALGMSPGPGIGGGGGGIGGMIANGIGSIFGKAPVVPPTVDNTLTTRASAARQPIVLTVNIDNAIDGENVGRSVLRYAADGRLTHGRQKFSLVPA